MTSEESLYMVGIHSTVEKRAKRMPDTRVETTETGLNRSRLSCSSSGGFQGGVQGQHLGAEDKQPVLLTRVFGGPLSQAKAGEGVKKVRHLC